MADDFSLRRGQIDSPVSNSESYEVRVTIFELGRRFETKPMATVPITCINEVRPQLIRRDRH